MVAILDRIKKAETARAALAAARRHADIDSMTDAELTADLARVQADVGMSPERIARYALFFEALNAYDSAAQHAMERHRATQSTTPIEKLSDAEMRAELASFDALVNTRLACDKPSEPDLSQFA
jgi:hypothetical protein